MHIVTTTGASVFCSWNPLNLECSLHSSEPQKNASLARDKLSLCSRSEENVILNNFKHLRCIGVDVFCVMHITLCWQILCQFKYAWLIYCQGVTDGMPLHQMLWPPSFVEKYCLLSHLPAVLSGLTD